jgi:hypothetical protein
MRGGGRVWRRGDVFRSGRGRGWRWRRGRRRCEPFADLRESRPHRPCLTGAAPSGAALGVAVRDGVCEAGYRRCRRGQRSDPRDRIRALPVNTFAISAGDQAESVAAGQLGQDAAGAGQEFGAMFGVMFAPDSVGGVPLGARQIRGSINVVPVGRIVLLELGHAPGDVHFGEHGEVGGGVGGVGVEECAVPVEENAFEWIDG